MGRLWAARGPASAAPRRGPVLRERRREIEPADDTPRDEDLTDPGAGLALLLQSGVELIGADESAHDEELAERPPKLYLGRRQRLDRLETLVPWLLDRRPLLREHPRDLEPRHTELRHDDLAESLAGLLLHGQRSLELFVRDADSSPPEGRRAARTGWFRMIPCHPLSADTRSRYRGNFEPRGAVAARARSPPRSWVAVATEGRECADRESIGRSPGAAGGGPELPRRRVRQSRPRYAHGRRSNGSGERPWRMTTSGPSHTSSSSVDPISGRLPGSSTSR